LRSLAGWLAEHHPEVGLAEFDRRHVRGLAALGRGGWSQASLRLLDCPADDRLRRIQIPTADRPVAREPGRQATAC
jgi:hypothetical protein